MDRNIIKAVQVQNPYTGKWGIRCTPVNRYDQNIRVQICIDDLQNPFEAHITKSNMNTAKVIGQDNTLDIPDEYFTSYDPVFVWVMSSADTGQPNKRTQYRFMIPIKHGLKKADQASGDLESTSTNEEEE